MKHWYWILALIANLFLYAAKMTEINGLHPNMGIVAAIYCLLLLGSMALIEGQKIGYWILSILCLFVAGIWATRLTQLPIVTCAIMLACFVCVYCCHLMITKTIINLDPLNEADYWDGDGSDKILE